MVHSQRNVFITNDIPHRFESGSLIFSDLWITLFFLPVVHVIDMSNNSGVSISSADTLCVSKIFVPVICDFRFDFVGDYFRLHLWFIAVYYFCV